MNVPKLRFPEFSGEWEEKKLLECLTTFGDGIHGTPNYSENGEFYFINGNNLVDGKILISENTKKITRSEYEIIKRNLNDNTLLISINGTLGNVAFYNNEKIALGKSACFLNLNQFTNKVFCYYVLLTKKFHNYIYNVSTGTTIKNLSPTSISDYSSCFPCLAEQQTIADFLSNVDSIISAGTKILNTLQKKKKALMQKFFTQQLRFKSDDGTDFPEWEEKKLGDIATFSKGNGYSKSDLVATGTPVILYGRLYTKYETSISEVDTFVKIKKKSVFSLGSEIIVPASGETAEDISRASVVKQAGIVLDGDLNIIKVDVNKYVPEFIALCISNGEPKKRMAKLAQGKSVVHLHNSDLEQLNFAIPCKEEQQKIADCLSSMDSFIQKQQKVITTWQQRKKALLQQMFV